MLIPRPKQPEICDQKLELGYTYPGYSAFLVMKCVCGKSAKFGGEGPAK